MRAAQAFFWLLAIITTVHAFALPGALTLSEAPSALWKRKGGGGRGSSGSSSSGSSSSGSSSGSTGSTGSTGSSGSGASGSGRGTGTGGAARGSTVSNTGGSTRQGSGAPRSYGGSYAGGAAVPYTSGLSRSGLRTPFLIAPLAIFPGLWLYSAYAYPYYHNWNYRNNTSGQNETLPVLCLCEEYGTCGCDDNNSTDYQSAVANNASVAKVADVNGTRTLVLNGTLPNGTTAPGGDEDAYDNFAHKAIQMSGFWVVVAGVSYAVTFL